MSDRKFYDSENEDENEDEKKSKKILEIAFDILKEDVKEEQKILPPLPPKKHTLRETKIQK